jgi:CRISPR-associated protein Cas1
MARMLIASKVNNQATLLKERKKVDGLYADLNTTLLAIQGAATNEILLGLEGNASRRFFEEYYGDIGWVRRAPRTKGDIHNILLDIGYSMLFNCTDSLLRLHGFDTYKGFYHKLFFQRKSLACDMMEPFRCIIDKQLLKAWNLKQVDPKDFTVVKGRYVLSYEYSRKYAELFMHAIMDHKEDLYKYMHGFYRYVMNEGTVEFPEFKV